MSESFSPKTTVTGGADTADHARQALTWALVLLWSSWEPHRMGEVAFIPTFERRLFGRGDSEVEEFALFAKQRPGEPYEPTAPGGFLAGDGISRRQLLLRATAAHLEMEQVGRCVTLVNGEEKTSAILQEGDTILLKRQVLLLVVRRPKTLPGARALFAFGGPDSLGIVGEGPGAWRLREDLARAAATDDHVLIFGESGTGKEMSAAAVHNGSKRAKAPFVSHNASNCTLSLLEAELFGNAKNYPNPGMPARPGLVGAADRGTLFLDEIGELPHEAQAQLLRVLDAGECRSVGEETARRVDIRAIGATNREDDQRTFRTDFRARFPRVVRLPPLRERREDIPLLIRHWLLRRAEKEPAARRFTRVGPTASLQPVISGRLVDYLVRHPLRGNVRELEALLGAALDASLESAHDEVKLPSSLPSWKTTPPPESAEPGPETVMPPGKASEPSKEAVLAALTAEKGNISRAAARLCAPGGAACSRRPVAARSIASSKSCHVPTSPARVSRSAFGRTSIPRSPTCR